MAHNFRYTVFVNSQKEPLLYTDNIKTAKSLYAVLVRVLIKENDTSYYTVTIHDHQKELDIAYYRDPD